MAISIRKNFSLYLVIFSAISMFCLLVIQYMWTKNTIQAHEKNFERMVQESMSKVIYQTEKAEIAERIKGKYKTIGKGGALFNTLDSLNKVLSGEFNKKFTDSIITDSIISITKERINVKILHDNGLPVTKIDTSYIIFQKTEKNEDSYLPLTKEKTDIGAVIIQDDVHEKMADVNIDSLMQELDKILKRTFIVSDIFEDMFNLSNFLPLSERLNVEVLDSMVKQELKYKGITAEYELGIYDGLNKEFIYKKIGNDDDKLINSGQSFRLFPSDFFNIPNYVFIYFPFRKALVLGEMRLSLLISFTLLILIISIFTYVLVSFLRQKKLTQERNDFINNITHEFRTPLSTIALACEALKDPQVSHDIKTKDSYIDTISKENLRLSTMSEKILQSSMLDKNIKLNKYIIDAKTIILNVIDNMKLQIEQKGGVIHAFLMAENHKIISDKMHFTNVIFNLLDNSIKFSDKNPEIIVKTFNTANDIVIEVIDKGIGIPKNEHKKVFEKLYRVPSGNVHDVKGYGLGLSYVKSIVEIHKGSVSLESEPGKGTTIKLTFKTFNS